MRQTHLPRNEKYKLTTVIASRRLENSKLQHKDFVWYILDQQKRGAISQNEIIVNGALFM